MLRAPQGAATVLQLLRQRLLQSPPSHLHLTAPPELLVESAAVTLSGVAVGIWQLILLAAGSLLLTGYSPPTKAKRQKCK